MFGAVSIENCRCSQICLLLYVVVVRAQLERSYILIFAKFVIDVNTMLAVMHWPANLCILVQCLLQVHQLQGLTRATAILARTEAHAVAVMARAMSALVLWVGPASTVRHVSDGNINGRHVNVMWKLKLTICWMCRWVNISWWLIGTVWHCFSALPGPCESDPCQNGGTCTTRGSSYKCICAPGWTGKNCESKYSTCLPTFLLVRFSTHFV